MQTPAHRDRVRTTLSDGASDVNWHSFLSRWAPLTGLAYLALMVLFITLILPVGTTSSLPATYLELIAAGRKPVLYRLFTIEGVVVV